MPLSPATHCNAAAYPRSATDTGTLARSARHPRHLLRRLPRRRRQTAQPDLLLPARDLFQMARQETVDEFLARMVNGVKGDATIHFANPLTDAQIGALSTFYRSRAP